jgi:hypothetical protein
MDMILFENWEVMTRMGRWDFCHQSLVTNHATQTTSKSNINTSQKSMRYPNILRNSKGLMHG